MNSPVNSSNQEERKAKADTYGGVGWLPSTVKLKPGELKFPPKAAESIFTFELARNGAFVDPSGRIAAVGTRIRGGHGQPVRGGARAANTRILATGAFAADAVYFSATFAAAAVHPGGTIRTGRVHSNATHRDTTVGSRDPNRCNA